MLKLVSEEKAKQYLQRLLCPYCDSPMIIKEDKEMDTIAHVCTNCNYFRVRGSKKELTEADQKHYR